MKRAPFVTLGVDKSNFYGDLEEVTAIDYKQFDTKNKIT